MFCKNCGAEMNANQAVCIKCGVKVNTGNTYCANCGEAHDPAATVCLKCGLPLKKSGNDLGGHDKTSMALLAFFLGSLGVHNFVMGESKKGILRIILTFCVGIGWILALIDMIKILTDSYEIDPEQFI